MSYLHSPLPVKLFIGMLAQDGNLIASCTEELSRLYGSVDIRSPLFPWTHTDYYAREMGSDLLRAFIFFARQIDPGVLAEVKQVATEIEMKHAETTKEGYRRRINLDPGYITESKVVLATGKDFPHRVYIGRGVYAEATLRYNKSSRTFVAWEHTYPDFRTEEVLNLFIEGRERLRSGLMEDRGDL